MAIMIPQKQQKQEDTSFWSSASKPLSVAGQVASLIPGGQGIGMGISAATTTGDLAHEQKQFQEARPAQQQVDPVGSQDTAISRRLKQMQNQMYG